MRNIRLSAAYQVPATKCSVREHGVQYINRYPRRIATQEYA